MKQKHTQAKKARRFNNWLAYQKEVFSTSVFVRRVQGFFGADSAAYSAKHPSLDAAVKVTRPGLPWPSKEPTLKHK